MEKYKIDFTPTIWIIEKQTIPFGVVSGVMEIYRHKPKGKVIYSVCYLTVAETEIPETKVFAHGEKDANEILTTLVLDYLVQCNKCLARIIREGKLK